MSELIKLTVNGRFSLIIRQINIKIITTSLKAFISIILNRSEKCWIKGGKITKDQHLMLRLTLTRKPDYSNLLHRRPVDLRDETRTEIMLYRKIWTYKRN